jgi:serine/threonine protein kinase
MDMITLETLVCENERLRGCKVLRFLSEGAMGRIYLLQGSSGELVACKVMESSLAASAKARSYFVREIQHTKELEHPNIIELYESGANDEVLFYTMEYCATGSILDLMRSNGGKLSQDRAVQIVVDVLNGLEYAHHAPVKNVKLGSGEVVDGIGVVHRDLKPANILLGEDGAAKIADLGLAKAFQFAGLSGITGKYAKGGTLGFQPRQQAESFLFAKPAVDVWAAVATLYFMLTGSTPRNFDRSRSAREIVLETSPVPLLQRKPEVEPELAKLIDAALDDSHDLLYESAAQFREALTATLSQSECAAKTPAA